MFQVLNTIKHMHSHEMFHRFARRVTDPSFFQSIRGSQSKYITGLLVNDCHFTSDVDLKL